MKEVERRLHYVEMKKEWYAGNYEDHGYVSSREDGKPRGLSSMNQALTKLCERNGLSVITVHGLRHMFATILIERGVPLVKIYCPRAAPYVCDYFDRERRPVGKDLRTVRS